MSSSNGPNHLYPQYAVNSGSLSKYSPSISSRKEVYVNAAYENSEHSEDSTSHDYDDLQYVAAQARQINGGRRKANELYEPTGPLQHRMRQITECSDDSSASYGSVNGYFSPGESCLSRLILFLILVVSFTALILVVLIINGTVGPRGCRCQSVNVHEEINSPRTELSGSPENLMARIQELERNMSLLQDRMERREKTVNIFVFKQERKVKDLLAQVSMQREIMNYTSNKINESVESLESKVNTLKSTIKVLNKSQDTLLSTTNELGKQQTDMMQRNVGLAVNATRLESHVQRLAAAGSDIISRVQSLQERYKVINGSMVALQVLIRRRNATLDDLRNYSTRLRNSLEKVNTSLSEKVKFLSGSTSSSDPKISGNFSLCQHRKIDGVPSSTAISGSSTIGKGASASVDYPEPVDKRIVGATCSTDYARDYKLVITRSTQNIYHCECKGVSPVVTRTQLTIQCVLYVWECPLKTQ